MRKLVLAAVILSLVASTSSYGMRNISKKMPKHNVFKKDFSTKAWQWNKGWNNVKNYPTLWNNKLFNKAVIPSAKDIKIENVSIINKDTNNSTARQNIATQGDKETVINLSDPKQSSEFARKIMSIWKEVKEGPLRKFFESIRWLRNRKKILQNPSFAQTKIKHEEQTGGNYWKYMLGSAAAAYLAKLFSDTAQQKSSEEKEISFDYSLDGELARSMSAETFVALLHKYGLTVADAVEYQVKKKEEEIYKELTELAELNEYDWRMLQNLWKLKEEFLQGHYDEENITFKGDFDSQTIAMVKSVLQKADIPCQVTVVTKDTKTLPPETSFASAASVPNFGWTVNLEKAKFTSFGFVNVELYLSDNLLKSDEQSKLAVLAHEATHLLNMHHFEQIFFANFLQIAKSFDENKIKNCLFPLERLHEYQADVLPLAVPEYAQAQKDRSSYTNSWLHKNAQVYRNIYNYGKSFFYKDSLTRIHIEPKELFTLSSRAVELHEAEAELLKTNRIKGKK